MQRPQGRPVGHPRSGVGTDNGGSCLFASPESGSEQKAGSGKWGWEWWKGLFLFVWGKQGGGKKKIPTRSLQGKEKKKSPNPSTESRFERWEGAQYGKDAFLI